MPWHSTEYRPYLWISMLYNYHVCVLCMTRSGTQSHLFPINSVWIADGWAMARLLPYFCEKYSACCICYYVVLRWWDFICLWYSDAPNRIVIERFYIRMIDNASVVPILSMGACYCNLFMKGCKSNFLRFCAFWLCLYFHRKCLDPDSKVHGANMGPTRAQVGPMLAPWSMLSSSLTQIQIASLSCTHFCILQVLKFWIPNL